MFMLYALVIGLVVGRLLGGRLDRIAALRFRWVPLALAGLAVQVALFSSPLTERVGALGPPLYVASTIAVLVVVGRNITIPGLALVALGALSNLAAIVANGGFMPASPSALEALGRTAETGFSNSVVLTDPVLAPLTDVFAMPAFLPFANVFSVGDVLIGLGVGLALVSAMRRPVPPDNSPDRPGGTSTSGLFRTRP
ncbi:MAG: DUF5317 domain-containing protein [Chloroflexota bacterium]